MKRGAGVECADEAGLLTRVCKGAGRSGSQSGDGLTVTLRVKVVARRTMSAVGLGRGIWLSWASNAFPKLLNALKGRRARVAELDAGCWVTDSF
jgi:hypothetical protein